MVKVVWGESSRLHYMWRSGGVKGLPFCLGIASFTPPLSSLPKMCTFESSKVVAFHLNARLETIASTSPFYTKMTRTTENFHRRSTNLFLENPKHLQNRRTTYELS